MALETESRRTPEVQRKLLVVRLALAVLLGGIVWGIWGFIMDRGKEDPGPKRRVWLNDWEVFVRRHWGPGSFEDEELRAMYIAITAKDFAGVESLLNRGVSPNVVDNDGTTPLLLAFRHDEEIFRLLLERGAKSDVPIHVEFATQGLVPPGESVLTLAVATDGDWFEILKDYPFDVNTRGHKENTLLHRLIPGNVPLAKKLERMEWLIERGADLHLENAHWETPLGTALRSVVAMPLLEPLIENGGTPRDRKKFESMLEFLRQRAYPGPSVPEYETTAYKEVLDRLQEIYAAEYGSVPGAGGDQ